MTVSAIVQAIPQTVLDAALAQHQRKNTELTCSPFRNAEVATAERNSLWRCADGEIEFANLEARNHCAALATFRHVMPLSSIDALFDAAYELWRNEIGHPDSASGRLLGFASQNVNVLMEAAQAIRNKQHQAFSVFNMLHLIEAALPHLSGISAEAVIAVVDAQHESTKRDMAGGVIFNAIERRLRSESELAWEIWRLTKGNMSESMQSLYSTALQALMHTDQQSLALEKAREDADDIDPLTAGAALWTLGRAIQAIKPTGTCLDECVAVLTSKTRTASPEVQQTAIRAVAHASLKDERLMSELTRLAAERDNYTLAVVADFLFMNQQELPVSSAHFKTLLQSLVGLLPSQQNALDNFDWVLHQLYATPEYRPLVLDCLTQWAIQHGSSSLQGTALIEQFDQTIMQIVNDKPGFQAVITNWLVAPEKQLAVACGGLISYLHIRGMKSPALSAKVLDTFTFQDFKFLARRLLGYVISEEPLLSLTFSLLETNNAPKRSFGWVYSLLTEDVGRDYAHATTEALKVRQEAAKSPEKELLEKIHAILLQRSKAMDDLPRLQELRPPMRLRRSIALNRTREMEQAMEIADEKSIFRSISTVIPMKAGRGWFSVSDNKVGPTQHLQSISHSVSLPKRALTDPVGYAIAGLHYRIAKRDDE
ncbi:hypothetical protein [Polaromonas sp.]|uniref:hypothetical protein n=1 Tax=Polaromonas sp. TaxID=1869339 RepID=UPI003BA96F74